MDKAIIHWTAGTHRASAVDRRHYHVIVDGDGEVHRGDHSFEDNISTADGHYAAHTRGCNTDAGGFTCCGMRNATEYPLDYGDQPVTERSMRVCAGEVAKFCQEYDLPVSRGTVMTHAEVEGRLGIKQLGKWDYTVIPWRPDLRGATECGDYIRGLVREALGAAVTPRPEGSHSGRARVRYLQKLLRLQGFNPGKLDGLVGPNTRRATTAFQEANGLPTDGRLTAETVAVLREIEAEQPEPDAPEKPHRGELEEIAAILDAAAERLQNLAR